MSVWHILWRASARGLPRLLQLLHQIVRQVLHADHAGIIEQRHRGAQRVVELAQIAEVLSWKNLLKRFRDKLVEFSENPICWEALKVGRDFESEKDGKRAERVLEKGAREKLKEMNQLEKEMDEWSPFDDVEEGRAASKRLELERSGFAPDRNYDGQAL